MRAVTAALRASVKSAVVTRPLPSAFSVSTLGLAIRPVSSAAAGAGAGSAGRFPPSVPEAGSRSELDAIGQRNGPFPAAAELHVQSTRLPLPRWRTTTLPAPSATVIVHASELESRAWNRTSPPRRPDTTGE